MFEMSRKANFFRVLVPKGPVLFAFTTQVPLLLLLQFFAWATCASRATDGSRSKIYHARFRMAKARDLRNFVEFGRKIVAVGRNYRDHAAELGNPVPEKPLIFLKPTSSYVKEGKSIEIPYGCTELHHEVELGIVIGKMGKCIPQSEAMDHVGGYALAIDMTDRQLQNELKKKGLPWTTAKGFDTSNPISDFVPKTTLTDPTNVQLWLKVDEEMKQDGNTKDMIFSIPFLINYISKIMTLQEGDLIITGTPSGVSKVKKGQSITAGLGNYVTMKFEVIDKK